MALCYHLSENEATWARLASGEWLCLLPSTTDMNVARLAMMEVSVLQAVLCV